MIATWSKGPADEFMPEEAIVATLAKVRKHPWWRARAKLAIRLLVTCGVKPPASVVDVGCGWGVNLGHLEAAGYRVTGIDISRRILELIDAPERKLVEADLNQIAGDEIELQEGLLALDVIEHLDDDRAAVCRLAAMLRPGGIAIISVPALPELFSEFDTIQGHRRRYVPDTLRAAFADSGFLAPRIIWWGAWMVPVLRRMRNGSKARGSKTYADYLRVPPWPMPLLMHMAFAWEERRAIRGDLGRGTSLFAIAKRAE